MASTEIDEMLLQHKNSRETIRHYEFEIVYEEYTISDYLRDMKDYEDEDEENYEDENYEDEDDLFHEINDLTNMYEYLHWYENSKKVL